MNFFKSKEPDITEISREKRTKEAIISELSACLKNIQTTQQSRRPGEPIYTCDSSNQLCYVLEAVFLHGHKSTQGARKVQSTDSKAFDRCSYWSFVQRFTHKDTISQLKRLAHIKTETGVCRAWVKLAINDGLTESYITAMLAQPNVLGQYYTKTAMLRDLEQPEILLKLIQVLSAANYDFQLVYNSSQLNVWGMKTLALAGLVERQFLFDSGAAVSPAVSHAATPENRSRTSTLDMEDFSFFVTKGESQPPAVPGPLRELSPPDSITADEAVRVAIESAELFPGHTSVCVTEERSIEMPSDSLDTDDSPLPQVPANTPHEGFLSSKQTLKTHIHEALRTLGEEETEVTDDVIPSSKSADSLLLSGGSGLSNTSTPVRNPNQAERELARMRSTNYSISDIIEDIGSSSPLETNTDDITQVLMSDNKQEIDTNPFSDSSETDRPEFTKHKDTSPFSHDDPVSDENVHVESSIGLHRNSYDEEPYGSPAVLGSYFPPPPPAAAAAKFVVGTPQDHQELLSSHEHSHEIESEDEDDIEEAPYLQDETADSDENEKTISPPDLPLSAAQAIMNKRNGSSDISRGLASAGARPNSVGRAPHGNSLGGLSHGNSLASLTGWGSVDQEDSSDAQSKPLAIQKVQSFADLVSEHSQTEELVYGSPKKDYTANTAPSSSLKDNTIHEENSQEISKHKGEDDSGSEKSNEDDFELVGGVEKKDEDILANYGDLCYELGLDQQDYKCYSCGAPVGIIYGFPRVCSYTKRYYCVECHINEDSYIPSKIIYNWDFAKYKVSKASRDFLMSAESMPLIDVQILNPRLYEHIPELERCKLLRTQLFFLKRYLFSCNKTIADELKQKFWPKEYIYEEIHTYSIQDLIQLSSNTSLANQMKKVIKFARTHVVDCESCQYRGFLCEICSSTEVIYPFDLDTAARCDKCNAVYHKLCFTSDCPKCERMRRRDQLLAGKSPEQACGIDDVY